MSINRSTSCAKKKRYTKEEAELALQSLRNSPGYREGHALHVYECRYCQAHHIGHIPSPIPPRSEWIEHTDMSIGAMLKAKGMAV